MSPALFLPGCRSDPNVTSQPTPSPPDDFNTADILVETFNDWGATHVFGMVGDGINAIIEALRKRQDRIHYVGVRHEEAAAFMAYGFAKHTGASRCLYWHDRSEGDERALRCSA